VRGRMGASWRAWRAGGFGHWRARARYHATASELAFHRARVARGLAPRDEAAQAREEFYRRALAECARAGAAR
jgi:hypothetical protein